MAPRSSDASTRSPSPAWPVVIPDSKVRAPQSRQGEVPRDRVLASALEEDHHLLVVLASAGYGKTTLARQWVGGSDHPQAWATLAPIDNDPVVLMSTVLAAMTSAGVQPGPMRTLTGDEPTFSRRVLPEYRQALAAIGEPVSLVLDDIHVVRDARASQVLTATLESLPPPSRIAVCGRARPDLPLERWRGQQRVVELGPDDLTFDSAETTACLAHVLRRTPTAQEVEAVRATSDGWPVAVYLEGRSVRRGAFSHSSSFDFGDYLSAEVLHGLGPDILTFLQDTSVLSTLNSSLCDAVLTRNDSAELLRQAASATLLISRLSGPGGWYRTHPLLREHLADRLSAESPDRARALHCRAARWYASDAQAEVAIAHAIAGRDPDLLAEVAWDHGTEALMLGRTTTVQGWLDQIGEAATGRTAGLAVLAAWTAVDRGDATAVQRWAEAGSHAFGPDWVDHLRRSAVEPALALLVCLGGSLPHAQAAGFAHEAAEALPAGHPTRALAVLIEGWCLVLAGSTDEGLDRLMLAHALSESMEVGTTTVEAPALAGYVLASRGQWRQAESVVAAADSAWTKHDLQDAAPATSLLVGIDAFLHARKRPIDRTRADLTGIAPLLPDLAQAMPAVAVLVACFVARTWAGVGDLEEAVSALDLAELAAPHLPESPWLTDILEAARRDVSKASPIADLTASQCRIWFELATDKTVNEIARDLFVSPNTVKAHLREVYRKLGVSSRREAVRLAPQLPDGTIRRASPDGGLSPTRPLAGNTD